MVWAWCVFVLVCRFVGGDGVWAFVWAVVKMISRMVSAATFLRCMLGLGDWVFIWFLKLRWQVTF